MSSVRCITFDTNDLATVSFLWGLKLGTEEKEAIRQKLKENSKRYITQESGSDNLKSGESKNLC